MEVVNVNSERTRRMVRFTRKIQNCTNAMFFESLEVSVRKWLISKVNGLSGSDHCRYLFDEEIGSKVGIELVQLAINNKDIFSRVPAIPLSTALID